MSIQTRTFILLLALSGCGQGEAQAPCIPAPVPSPPRPAIGGIFPSTAYPDRLVELELIGVNTSFETGTLIDFDDPEIQSFLILNGPSSLRLVTRVGPMARLGAHDVIIDTFGPTEETPVHLVLKGGFTILPSLDFAARATPSSVPQGGLTQVSVQNLDYRDNPISTNSVMITSGPRVVSLLSAASSRYSYLGLVDATAPVGGLSVTLTAQNPLGQSLSYRTAPADPNRTTVTARTGIALLQGQSQTGKALTHPLDTDLYQLRTQSDNEVLRLTYSDVGGGLLVANPVSVIAPESGRFSEGQIVSYPSAHEATVTALALIPKAGTSYVAMFAGDYGGDPGLYSYKLTADSAQAELIDLTEPPQPDGPTTPLARVTLDRQYYSANGSIEPATDVDYIGVHAVQSGRLYVQATGTQSYSLRIGLYAADCSTAVAIARGFQQEVAVEAGKDYCVRLSAPTATAYRLILASEGSP